MAVHDHAKTLKTFYTKPAIFEAAEGELCIALDVTRVMGGTEAVVESYYSVTKGQSQKDQ